ncbi:hypothetical protein Tco_1499829 [Tanacetum coccineum]
MSKCFKYFKYEVLNKQRYLSDNRYRFGVESSMVMESDNSLGNTNSKKLNLLYPNTSKDKRIPFGTIQHNRGNPEKIYKDYALLTVGISGSTDRRQGQSV